MRLSSQTRRAAPLLTLALLACSAEQPAPESNIVANGAVATDPASPPLVPAEPGAALDQPAAVPASEAPYNARGQEPGWLLTIADGRIDYEGNYGERKISVPAPAPATTPNGRRYAAKDLTIDITGTRCNDAMSGQGYQDTVKVVAFGETYEGCGGARRTDWDN